MYKPRWYSGLTALACAGFGLHSMPAKADYTVYAGNGPIPSIDLEVRIDAAFRALTNVDNAQYNGKPGTGTVLQGDGNDWGTSLYGLSGVSVISDQLSGVYRVEGGFDATNGTFNGGGSSIFNRRAYAGLSNPEAGTILLGKDLFIDNDVYFADPMTQQNSSTSTLVDGRNWQGTNQMIEYRSPTWAGFKIGAMASAINGKKSSGFNSYGVSAQYTLGGLNLYAIGDDVHDANGHFSSIYSASREGIFAATYQLGVTELFAGYEILSAPQASASNPLSVAANSYPTWVAGKIYPTLADQFWIGADAQVTPTLLLQGAVFHTSINKSGGSANMFVGGATYNLNKYVFVYATAADVENSGNADFTANIYSPLPRPGTSQFAGFTGIGLTF